MQSKADIWPIPAADKAVWVRIADPNAQEITLSNDSKAAIHWLAQRFAYEFAMPMARPPLLTCLSAAGAVADGSQVGIGGWLCTSHQTFWFAQQWSIQELRTFWPFLTRTPSSISLASRRSHSGSYFKWPTMRQVGLRFCLPTRSDNSPTQASVNKLFTTSFPLCPFLQKVASWAHAKGLCLKVGHIPDKFAHASRAKRFPVHLQELHRSEHDISLWPPQANWSPGLLQVASLPA